LLTVVLIVDRKSGFVAYIAMPAQNFISRAISGAFKGVGVAAEYWTGCYPEDLEPYLNDNYEFWLYDTDSESDEPAGSPADETDDALTWEFTPVQMFAKTEPITKEFVFSCSSFIGFGNEFDFEEVAAEFPNFISRPARPLESRLKSKTDRKCPWCNVTAVKRYNFFRPDYNDQIEAPFDMDNPVLWTDGCWSEVGVDPDNETIMDNTFGDSVVCCPACNALFLASRLEKESERAEIEASGRLFPADAFVAPGKCKQGHFESSLSDEWIVFASLDETLDYLEQNLAATGEVWSQWTASQQIINWMSYLTRTGQDITPQQDQHARALLVRFRASMMGIKEGTLGAFYGFVDILEEASSGNNYWGTTFELEDTLPLTNLRRIIGDRHKDDYLWSFANGDISMDELIDPNSSEVEQYIARRRLLLGALMERKDTRWAVHSGELDKRS
jgi:hypothetical protein